MPGQGFQKVPQQQNSLGKAAELLLNVAQQSGRAVVLPMFPPGNSRGLAPGEIKPGQSEIPPDCDGLVIAVACSADDAQALIDLLMNWQRKRLLRQEGGDCANP